MPVEEEMQLVFFAYTYTLEPVGLGALCQQHDMRVEAFLAWVDRDKVRVAKMAEVTQTRIMDKEKNKK